MFSLSRESEQDLTHGLLDIVGKYLEGYSNTNHTKMSRDFQYFI